MTDLYLNNSLVKKDLKVDEVYHASNLKPFSNQTVELKDGDQVIYQTEFKTLKPTPSPIEIASVTSNTSDDVTIIVKSIDNDQKLSVLDKDNKVIATANTGVKTIHIKGLNPGTKYPAGTYTLKATNSFNDEVTADIPEFTVAWKPPAPVIEKMDVPDGNHVVVTVKSISSIDKLQIKDVIANKVLVNGTVGSNSVRAPGLTPGKTYKEGDLIIYAKNDNAISDSTNIPEFTTQSASPELIDSSFPTAYAFKVELLNVPKEFKYVLHASDGGERGSGTASSANSKATITFQSDRWKAQTRYDMSKLYLEIFDINNSEKKYTISGFPDNISTPDTLPIPTMVKAIPYDKTSVDITTVGNLGVMGVTIMDGIQNKTFTFSDPKDTNRVSGLLSGRKYQSGDIHIGFIEGTYKSALVNVPAFDLSSVANTNGES